MLHHSQFSRRVLYKTSCFLEMPPRWNSFDGIDAAQKIISAIRKTFGGWNLHNWAVDPIAFPENCTNQNDFALLCSCVHKRSLLNAIKFRVAIKKSDGEQ
jgi:hypothetical protein